MNSYILSRSLSLTILLTLTLPTLAGVSQSTLQIPDTGQIRCYNQARAIRCPAPGQPFFGQDAQYQSLQPTYRDNGDSTVTDLNTGLRWSKGVSTQKLGLEEAQSAARKMTLGGYKDWRVPTIKELYSLIDFRGYTGSPSKSDMSVTPSDAIPFINTDYFDFVYGLDGERYIDAQWLSATQYVSTTMGDMETLFGVNFADGRIKGYGYKKIDSRWERKKFYVRYVRGKPYGNNRFEENGDGTVTDRTTGLQWSLRDSARGMNWQDALNYAENLKLAGHSDWRLPNAKELQYIVDYTRSPDSSDSAAISPLFQTTSIINEAGEKDYPAYWTSTTHLDGTRPGSSAVYIAFGRALGEMRGQIMDVHGAGAQRSDPKAGQSIMGRGPQGDAVRVDNYVRVVRQGATQLADAGTSVDYDAYPYQVVLAGERSVDIGQNTTDEFSRHFVNRLDRDGDGRVSRKEFDGPEDRFDFHDISGDGYLTEDETPLAPANDGPPNRNQAGVQNQPDPRDRQPGFANTPAKDFAAGFVERLDQDGDGRVSRSEFDGPKDHFGFHDTDGDGYLTEDEAPKGPPRGGRRPFRPMFQ
ncbi:MAG: DUF1566 domain-containing protein [Candidatus Thiodiazotropha sp. L084R]